MSAGTVEVSIDIARDPAEVWEAVSEPGRLGEWFGAVDGPLTAGTPVRVDFGDGDFFVMSVRRVEPPRTLEFSWRFLGVGPADEITWKVEDTGTGSRFSVVDTEPDRDEQGVAELTEGWRDFVGRLRAHVETGMTTRYGWRSEIDGSVDLRPGLSPEELPVFSGTAGRRRFEIDDGKPPGSFAIDDWKPSGDREVRFNVRIPGAVTPTNGMIRIERTAAGDRLYFRHSGWTDLGLGDEHAQELRSRFAGAWIAALRTAAAR
jgi:uncharacterized protein YndB with AHSA1/START domain